MKLEILVMTAAGAVACSSSDQATTSGPASSMSTPGPSSALPSFHPLATMNLSWGDGAPVQVVRLPVPVRRPSGLWIAALHIPSPTRWPNTPEERARKEKNEIGVPVSVVYWDAMTGARVDYLGMGNREREAAHFGFASPPDGVVGHFDDAHWLPEARRDLLRDRILAALDVLLPFFADENRPWTEEATKAAGEVRDFFPLAAEPGLWPYYRAEGKELFTWAEAKAPPGKTPLPWESTVR